MLNGPQQDQASFILGYYGLDAQKLQAIQEAGELIVALTKSDVHAIVTEVADNYIMLEQLVQGMGIESEVKEEIQFKLARQEGRINSAKKRAKMFLKEDR